ncbi:ABC transporter substrate-binding protein [Burkholderia vietnamiensis]|uniref:ABC transporter substrate-binding protein n=1 Tax=Burkholderia vietnamiensis TaxID=60552 RepID=UPI001B9F38EB|nr:ABC transporter substrate-binding protein [Burkholderia vietnamiensis]MBR8202880.1 ABC transporter substrate-binding protein [Burkholderia vietnamiensis]MCA8392244.1 ABC transporter substrate-binding protein [Burkholderia vietnamiensis]HDR8961875.1 ABC transporter substrate-binding protein [Burkholderia vietnamiensis]HDR9242541.1 ABC transporter substrate-binding protein [Burkholderia vietnamiensis]
MPFAPKPLAAALALVAGTAVAQVPAGYPGSYQGVVDAAKKEGKLIVYSTTDTGLVRPLIKDFESLYGVKVEYNDMNSTELYNRYISENAASSTSADVLWSSAMDLQVKLVNDGLMASYDSPESQHVPQWAQYQKQAYGTTFEPLAIVYNKRLIPENEVPKTRADLIRLLTTQADKFKGKVTTYDIEKSGVGFNYLTQDAHVNEKVTWELVKAIGATGPKLQSSTGAMMERISSGENLIGYNIIGSYAYAKAKNPNAAKLWVDYLLSKRGQTLIANQANLYAIRTDVAGETSAASLTKKLGDSLKPIQIGTGLLVYLDQSKRLAFLKQWQQAIKR